MNTNVATITTGRKRTMSHYSNGNAVEEHDSPDNHGNHWEV